MNEMGKFNKQELEKKLDETQKNLAEENLDFLINLLKNGTPLYRDIAFRQLKSFRTKEAPEKIAELFREPDSYLRNAAVAILAELWDLSRDVLTKLIRDEDRDVRKLALDSLNLVVGDESVIDIIALALYDEDINNVIAAVEYIGEHGGEKYAEEILNILLNTDNEFLSSVCLKTLAEIGNSEIARRIAERFSNCSQIDDITLLSYLRLLYKFPEVVDINFLLEIFEEKWDIALKEILDVLIAYVGLGLPFTDEQKEALLKEIEKVMRRDIHSQHRYEIIILLSELEPEKMKKEVVAYLYSDDSMEQLAAIELITKFRLKELIGDLEKVASESKNKDVSLAAQFAIQELQELMEEE